MKNAKTHSLWRKAMKNREKMAEFISVLTIFGAIIFFLITPSPTIEKADSIPKKTKMGVILPTQTFEIGPSYDFENMLTLIQRFRNMEKAFHSDFDNFIIDLNNLASLRKVFNELTKEKINFRKYLHQIKAFYKKPFPHKKRTSLRYYMRVIEESIDELEEMIEKFNLKLTAKQT